MSGPDETEDDLAAEWAAMAGEDAEPDAGAVGEPSEAAAAAPAGRELSQDEIDSLLGFSAVALKKEKSGIHSIVQSKDVTYERLPMLEVVFDRLERMLTTSMRNFTSENVDIDLDNVRAQRFGDYLNSVPLPAMIAVFKAVEWDNYGLITIDSSMIYSIVDVLLGGRHGTVPMRVEGRPYTTIEASLVERMVRLVLEDLGHAFAPVTEIHFRFERIETDPRFAAIARPGNACVVFKMRVGLEDRGGGLEFVIPYATLEPARALLLQMFMGEKFGRDSIWENHLAREMWSTNVELDAVLEEQTVSLSDVARLAVGSTLRLHARADSQIVLRCGNVPMARGRIGRRGERIIIEVDERIDRQKELTCA